MKLSALQKFILTTAYEGKSKVHRSLFYKYYNGKNKPPKGEDKVKILTKSIERLIKKGLIVGFGELTRFKSYIYDVKLTAAGKNYAKKLLGEQGQLPLKRKKH